MVVVLPAPFGPRKAMTSPAGGNFQIKIINGNKFAEMAGEAMSFD
jgi:hypothetical protein